MAFVVPDVIDLRIEASHVKAFLCSQVATGEAFTKSFGGLEHKFGRGGGHAAAANCSITEDDRVQIVDIDFCSFYPYIMLRYVPWFWHGMSREQFRSLLIERINAKFNGKDNVANSIKQRIATAYGLARRENDELGFRVCAIGQLILVDLLDKLRVIGGLKVLNTNTDGVIIAYPRSEEHKLVETVEVFKARIRIPIEYVEIHKLIQRNVNCYIAELGESFIYRNGAKCVLKPDTKQVKVKGLSKDLPLIVKNAVAEELLFSKSIRSSIYSCEDLKAFAVDKSDTDKKSYRWQVNDKFMVLRDSFSIYATNDNRYGVIGYLASGNHIQKVAGTSKHSIADTKGLMQLNILDKEYYVNMANELVEVWSEFLRKEEKVHE